MAQTLNALIYPSAPTVVSDRRMIDVATIPAHKAAWWRPVVTVGNDAFDPLTQKKTGPVTTIEATQVVDTYSIVALTAPEISARKDNAATNIDVSSETPLLKILLVVVNDARATRAKLNALIDATGQAATVTKYPANQSAQGTVAITMAQLKTAIRAELG